LSSLFYEFNLLYEVKGEWMRVTQLYQFCVKKNLICL